MFQCFESPWARLLTPCVLRHTCFSAPHAALRIACLWSRFIVGVVFVFVGLLRTRVSLKRSVVGGIFLMVVEQLESRFTWVLKGVFLKELCRFQHKFLEERSVEALSVASNSSVLRALSLDTDMHLVHFSFTLMSVVLTLFFVVFGRFTGLCVVRN